MTVLPPPKYGRFRTALFLLIIVLAALLAWPPIGRTDYHKNLLILNSYAPGYKWTDDIVQGVYDAVQKSGEGVRVSQDFMDTKRISDPHYFRLLYDTYRYKYKNSKFDVIIASDDDAFDFLREYRDLLFPGTPVVFCGVNDFQPVRLQGTRLFTGVNEGSDIKATLNLALKLHPRTRQIVVVNDTTITGRAVHREIMEALPAFQNRVKFRLLEDMSMPEILSTLRSLPRDSLVFYTFFSRDKNGRTFAFDESVAMVSNASPVPVYGAWDYNLGRGIVGGMLTCGSTQGRTAGELAIRILHGERADRIPVVMRSPNRWEFDYRQLKRFGITPTELPAGSTIVNKPLNLYTVHMAFIWSAVAAFAALSLIILLLLVIMAIRRRSEAELARKEQRYRSLVIATSQIVWMTDGAGHPLGDPSSWQEYTGQSKEEVEKSGHCLAVHPDDRERSTYEWQRAAATRTVYAAQYRLRRRDGEYRHFLVRAAPVPDESGRIAEWIWTGTDITESKRSEEALRQSEELFRSAFNQSAAGIIYLTPDAKWLRINQKFCQITGYSVEELKGLTLQQITHPEDWARISKQVTLMLQGKIGSYSLEKRYLRKDGSSVWAHVNLSMVDDGHGNNLFMVGVVEDITARKQVEEDLRRLTDELEKRVEERTRELAESGAALERQNRQLRDTYQGLQAETEERIRVMEELRLKDQLLIHQSRLAAMGEMLGNIAHQWRQPLNVLGLKIQEIGLSYKLGTFSGELLNTNIAKAMEILVHLSKTIDDFRTFSTPDKQRAVFKVGEVIAKTVSLVEENFKVHGIILETSCEGDPVIDGYPNEYTQVLLNILMNSRDAFQERGIADGRIAVRCREEAGRTEVTITDNAGGIDERIIDKIFDAYFTTKELGKGTGVGLFMSKTIIEKHMGGRLEVRNIDGGAQFRISAGPAPHSH